MTITELAREARGHRRMWRYGNTCTLPALYRAWMMAPIREYSGRLRQRIEDHEKDLPSVTQHYRRVERLLETEHFRDEWRQTMRRKR